VSAKSINSSIKTLLTGEVVDKKEIILNTIIEEYLKHSMPIGSNELREKLDIDISPSTIRVYFKKLSYEGILRQLHTSSGRVPTWEALKRYWIERFSDIDELDIGSSVYELKKWIKEFDVYCILQYKDESKLSEIINVDDRFLLIIFQNSSVVLEYNEKVERFLTNLIGYDINKIKNISINVGLYELRKKIEQLLEANIVLKEKKDVLYEMSKYYDYCNINIENFMHSSIFEKVENGIYFEELVPKGYMAMKHEAKIDKKEVNFLCVGKVDNSYKEFLNEICTRR